MRPLLIFSIFLCISCQNNNNTLSQFDWLEGQWQREEEFKFYSERWTKVNDKLLRADGFILKGTDTLMQEQILLEQRADGIFFIPKIKDQNEGKAVEFKLVSTAANQFVFENKDHDFPQRIVYTNPHPDTLDAWIEGISKGQQRRIPFKLAKK